MNNTLIMLIGEVVGIQNVKLGEPMSKHTTFRVGGPAKMYIMPQNELQLCSLVKLFRQFKETFYIIGNGSNILVGDKGIDGVVIEVGKSLGEIDVEDDVVTAGAGVLLSKLAASAARNGLSGLEFASGIPGSLGGAVYMNAGAYGGEMKDVVFEVSYIDENSKISRIEASECDFGYRHSAFTNSDKIIVGAKLKLEPKDEEEIKVQMKELTEKRITKQPIDKASAGSTFKRPTGYYAAALIEESGLKGYTVGGASVSEKHAGFVVNNGTATAKDICDVIEHVKKTVKNKFNVDLETEVKYLGEFE